TSDKAAAIPPAASSAPKRAGAQHARELFRDDEKQAWRNFRFSIGDFRMESGEKFAAHSKIENRNSKMLRARSRNASSCCKASGAESPGLGRLSSCCRDIGPAPG